MKLALSTTTCGLGRIALACRCVPKRYKPLPLQRKVDKVFHRESVRLGCCFQSLRMPLYITYTKFEVSWDARQTTKFAIPWRVTTFLMRLLGNLWAQELIVAASMLRRPTSLLSNR